METPTLNQPHYFFDTTVLVAYFKKEDAHTHDLVAQVLDDQASAPICDNNLRHIQTGEGNIHLARSCFLIPRKVSHPFNGPLCFFR